MPTPSNPGPCAALASALALGSGGVRSIAMALVFPSVEVDGRRLVDGVVSDPPPVSVADDAVAVLTLGLKVSMPRRTDRASRLVAQASTALIDILLRARIDAARASGQRLFEFERGWIDMSGCGRLDPCPTCSRPGRARHVRSCRRSWRWCASRRSSHGP